MHLAVYAAALLPLRARIILARGYAQLLHTTLLYACTRSEGSCPSTWAASVLLPLPKPEEYHTHLTWLQCHLAVEAGAAAACCLPADAALWNPALVHS